MRISKAGRILRFSFQSAVVSVNLELTCAIPIRQQLCCSKVQISSAMLDIPQEMVNRLIPKRLQFSTIAGTSCSQTTSSKFRNSVSVSQLYW